LLCVNIKWGNANEETRVSKWGLRRVQVDFGFTLKTNRIRSMSGVKEKTRTTR